MYAELPEIVFPSTEVRPTRPPSTAHIISIADACVGIETMSFLPKIKIPLWAVESQPSLIFPKRCFRLLLVSFTLPQIFFMIRLIFFIGILILLEVYAFQAIRTAFRGKWVAIGFEVVSLMIIAFVIYSIVSFDRSVGQNRLWLTGAALMFLMLLPKIVIGLTLLIEDIIRGFVAIYNAVSTQSVSISHLPQRRRFVSTLALGIAAVPFLGLLHGIFFGRYNFRVIRQQLFFDDLPDAFDGFTITQISDIHSGSFDNGEKIKYAIGLIN